MKCCGKCYLKKQLKKVDENSNGKKAPLKTDKSESLVFIVVPFFTAPEQVLSLQLSTHNPAYQHKYGSKVPFLILHPPSAAC